MVLLQKAFSACALMSFLHPLCWAQGLAHFSFFSPSKDMPSAQML